MKMYFQQKTLFNELLNNMGKVKDRHAEEEDPNTAAYLRGKAQIRTLGLYTAKSPCLLSTSLLGKLQANWRGTAQTWQGQEGLSALLLKQCVGSIR